MSIVQATDLKRKNHREEQEYIGREEKMMSFLNIEEKKYCMEWKQIFSQLKESTFLSLKFIIDIE